MAHFQASLGQKRKCAVWRFNREFLRGTALGAQDFQPTFEKESAKNPSQDTITQLSFAIVMDDFCILT
jgi:hypothetical protein